MYKIFQVIITVSIVLVVYLLMIVIMPVVVEMSLTANATMNASSNMSQYPGASEGLIAAPWILWFVPAVIGMIVVFLILRSD